MLKKKLQKKKFFFLAAFLLAAGLFGIAPAVTVEASEEADKTLDVMFLHDTHSHLNPFDTVLDEESQVRGGFARIMTLINEQKEKNPDTLLLDGGDFAMGTLVQVVFADEAPELRLLGEMGFEATTLGNHEFDYGARGLASMMDNAVASGDKLPPMVVCNVDWEAMEAEGLTDNQKLLKASFENMGVQDYIVVEKGDVRVAITGVFGVEALKCVAKPPLAFKDPVTAVQETVAEIKANEDVDMIALLSHSGTSEDEAASEDEIIAKAVPDLDLILSAHTHTRLEEPIVHGDTYIVSCMEYGKFLGSLSMTQRADGRWNMDFYKLIPVVDSIEADPATQKMVDKMEALVDEVYLAQFDLTRDQVLCTNEVEFVSTAALYTDNTEKNLGSIVTDAFTYAVEHADTGDTHPVDMTLIPAGVIRDTFALGNITTEQVYNVFSLGVGMDGIPGYPLISVYLTGEEIMNMAEKDANTTMLLARLFTDGLYWSYNPKRMEYNKVTDVYLQDGNEQRVEIKKDQLYRVVMDYYTSLMMLSNASQRANELLGPTTPKYADGTPIANLADAVIHVDGKEMKAWVAIARYLQSFEDTDGDGIGNVPAKYSAPEGRKVIEEGNSLIDHLKHPNKVFFMRVKPILLGAALAVFAIILAVMVTKKVRRAGGQKKQKK